MIIPPSGSPNTPLAPPATQPRTNRRYKTQLRDFLSTCRSKRKLPQQPSVGQVTPPTSVVEYIPDSAAAVAAAYSNLNPMYTPSPYAASAENIYMTPPVHSSNFYPVTDNLFHQYRLQGVGTYYPDYHHSPASAATYVTNGFLAYDSYGLASTASSKEEKWQENNKYYSGNTDVNGRTLSVYSGYGSPSQLIQSTHNKTPKPSPPLMDVTSCSSGGPSPVTSVSGAPLNQTPNSNLNSANTNNNQTTNHNSNNSSNSSNITNGTTNSGSNGIVMSVTPKIEHSPPQQQQQHQAQQQAQYEPQRQTVLMWGTSQSTSNNDNRSPNTTPTSNGINYHHETHAHHNIKLTNHLNLSSPSDEHQQATATAITQQQQQQQIGRHLKWNGSNKDLTSPVSGVHAYPIHHQHHEGNNVDSSLYSQSLTAHHHTESHHHHHLHQPSQAQTPVANHQIQTVGSEVWTPATYSQYQYFTYHHAPQHASTQ